MPYSFRHATLPNGLTIIAETDPSALTAAAGFFVKTGARDERGDLMGVSHFLEHMMFKGTARRSAADLNTEFDAIGARNNAYTTHETTAFHAAVLPEFIPQTIDLLADMLRPALRPADFDTEKSVILEEIAMYKDDPFWVLYERSVAEHYAGHAMGHRVLGTTESITALKRDDMETYFRARYSADNTVVALAGRVDFDRATDQLAAACAAWQATRPVRSPVVRPRTDRAVNLTDARVTRGYGLLMADAPSAQDDRRYAAFVLAQLLGAAHNSRLHWSLIETGLAEHADAAFDQHDGCGDFRVFLECDPERLPECMAVVDREIAGLAAAITPDDVERIRAKVATGVTLAGEQPDGRMHRLGRLWLDLGKYNTLEDELDRINAVTVDDVRALLRDYPFTPRTVGTLVPA